VDLPGALAAPEAENVALSVQLFLWLWVLVSTMCYIDVQRPSLSTAMRNFFPSRHREQAASPVQSSRPHLQATAMPHFQTRAELDDGVTVSELSELEAQALCAREGIALFWPAACRA